MCVGVRVLILIVCLVSVFCIMPTYALGHVCVYVCVHVCVSVCVCLIVALCTEALRSNACKPDGRTDKERDRSPHESQSNYIGTNLI